jgi:hypothetical protein
MIYVECEDGTQFEAARYSGNGKYLIETGELNAGTKYRLAIHLDDELYHSEYIAPEISPPVKLSYRINYYYFINEKNVNDSTVLSTDILVSTQGYERQHGYYLWSYKEDWEVRALLHYPNYPYYCWAKDSSRHLIVGSTERLIENTIREKLLFSIYGSDTKVAHLYRIQIKQNAIHMDAFDYFNNQIKNSEQTGNIFGIIPSELMGNIRCTSNPDVYVIGYVDVATTTTDELYLDTKCYNPPDNSFWGCEIWVPDEIPDDGIIWGFVNYGHGYIQENCVDCTKRGGTEKKPENW